MAGEGILRRRLLAGGAAAGAAAAVSGVAAYRTASAKDKGRDRRQTSNGATAVNGDGSPFWRPFTDPMPLPTIKVPSNLDPRPAMHPVAGEAGRLPHQAWNLFPPRVEYSIEVRPGLHKFHSQAPEQEIWGYDGIVPGPTIVADVLEPIVMRFYNRLPADHIGYGSPEISSHLHGGHTPPESDGFAADYFSATKAGPTLPGGPGLFYDHHYPIRPDGGDPRYITNTLWYHDHREEFTAANVYKGLSGFFLVFDALDSGNEATGLRLPSGVGRYDIPLLLQDKKFDSSGYLVFDQFDPDGILGNKFLVNGKVQPYLEVEARKYRFRMLNGSLARYHEMYLADERDQDQEFFFIASDGNLLPEPLRLKRILMGMSERADIIVDFSQYASGTVLYLVNRMEQEDPRKPTGKRLYPGIRMLQFRVGNRPVVPDQSRIPERLRELPAIDANAAAITRKFEFERRNGQWAINDRFFDPERADAVVRLGIPEIWKLETKGGWAHPVHVHLSEFRILTLNGKAPPAEWSGRKDTISLLAGDKAEILVRFTDYVGKYVMHCHQTAHEDHAMMIRFDSTL